MEKLVKKSIDFKINGGKKLSGTIRTGYSKNGSVGLLCASLLNKGTTTLHGIARIEEVYRVIEILESIGVKVVWIADHSVKIIPPKKFDLGKLDKNSAIKTRSIIMLMGPLIHFLPSFSIPHAKGCDLGKRTIAAHSYALEELGVKIKVTSNNYIVTNKKLVSKEVVMYEAGDTATENILMAAALIPGKTVIKFASPNYMVQDICFFLRQCGIRIQGVGRSFLIVHGVKSINKKVEYHNSEDPIEAMTFVAAAIATNSELTITHVPINFMELELYKLSKMGLKYEILKTYKAGNGHTNLATIIVYPSRLVALDDKIHANHPGINMDNLPYFVIPALKAKGTTLIHDWSYENRAVYMLDIKKMGAKITLAGPHRLYVEGGSDLKPIKISCPPALRPSMVIMLAMLATPGISVLRNVYMINRGYEDIAGRLNSIGADIKTLE